MLLCLLILGKTRYFSLRRELNPVPNHASLILSNILTDTVAYTHHKTTFHQFGVRPIEHTTFPEVKGS